MGSPDAPALEGASRKFAGGRYEAIDAIGRGGAAVVYKARDSATNRLVALKQLTVPEGAKHAADTVALFEREFRTLAELSHPNIIAVHDYGGEGASAYYAMELVEGTDLRERSPLHFREACGLLAQVCSALSLVHSRGLLHRDISPRNIRCTPEGRAKLIDFGAMTPMGSSGAIVGTPAFMAPEVLSRSALDARTDLFSLGAVLYFVLTGRVAYPARDVSKIASAWQTKPEIPSRFNAEIPEALDTLVLSLLSIEPALRPRTAAEVMQRLVAISGVRVLESPAVSQSYLSAPVVVGRTRELDALRAEMAKSFTGMGRCLLIDAASGLGRSRLLDACVLEAKTSGATVLRSAARATSPRPLAIVQELGRQLVEAFPEVAIANAAALDPDGLARSIVQFALEHPLAIVVDDAEHADADSLAVLAALTRLGGSAALLVLLTAEEAAAGSLDGSHWGVLVRRSIRYNLRPLGREDVAELFRSVFGDVPNLRLMSDRIFDVSGGNPRVSMDLAQCLVDAGKIAYQSGVWALPSSLHTLELPTSAEEAIRQTLAALSPLARKLVETQAIASHDAFTLGQYVAVAGEGAESQVDRAVLELLRRRVLKSDGERYALSHRGWTATASATLGEETLRERHRALVPLYEGDAWANQLLHMLAGGLAEAAVDKLMPQVRNVGAAGQLNATGVMSGARFAYVLERCLGAAIDLGRPARDINDIRQSLVSFIGLVTEEEFYYRAAPALLEQLKQDSGYSFWEADDGESDANARVMKALGRASERYWSTSEAARVYRPDEAIRGLCLYVAVSIAVASRTQDWNLSASLPGLLEPFVSLSRAVAVIHENSRAAREVRALCRPERAMDLWTHVYDELGRIGPEELPVVEVIRNAVANGLSAAASSIGLLAGEVWAGVVEKDSFQRVNAIYLRRSVRLQQGDWEGAEQLRRKAEEFAVEGRGRQMFTTSTFIELAAHALAGDLLGVKQILDRIEPLAARFAGWVPWRTLAEAELERLRGDFALARSLYERTLGSDAASFGKLEPWWPMAAAGYVETLVELGDFEQARAVGLAGARFCEAREIVVHSYGISRALALAEAKLGDYGAAASRLEQVIGDQRHRGVTGLQLGATYEARARIAIWASDARSFEVYAPLAATEYRYGKNSPLGARYERLMNEARRFASGVLPQLPDLSSSRHEPTVPFHTQMVTRDPDSATTHVVEGAACSEANVETIAVSISR